MEKWQKERLRKNQCQLIQGIDQIDVLLDMLDADGILATYAVKSIRQETDQQKQVRIMLDKLQKRPPDAFEKFVKVLCLTGNDHHANAIYPGASDKFETSMKGVPQPMQQSGQRKLSLPDPQPTHTVDHRGGAATLGPGLDKRSLEDDTEGSVLAMGQTFDSSPRYKLPETWPDETRLTKDIEVRPVTSRSMMAKYNELLNGDTELVYPMTSLPRGRAVIISNDEFDDKNWNRYGNEHDARRIAELLQKLNFEVAEWKNKKEKELLSLLDEEGRFGPDTYDCFIMVILTHGKEGHIMTADNKYMPFLTIQDFFNSSLCFRFKNKPKLFFIQACQGTAKDNDEFPQRVAKITERFAGVNIDDTDAGLTFKGTDDDLTPRYADMYTAVATVPGFVAWRNTLYGTWFIQAIIEIFSNCACDMDLKELMMRVTNLVSKSRSKDKKSTQICNITMNTLRKAVYFFPGLTKRQ